MRNVSTALREHDEFARNFLIESGRDKNYKILGTFLYGSQNYGTATANSDVDTKVILIPTASCAMFNSVLIKELHLPNGEHCCVMDIRHFVDNLFKQNINYVEILFTRSFLLNDEYEYLWNKFFIGRREEIARCDRHKCINSICGQALHTIKENPIDGKKISNAYRLLDFLKKYEKEEFYSRCIHPTEGSLEEIIILKNTPVVEEHHKIYLIDQFNKMKLKNYPKTDLEDLKLEEIRAHLNQGMFSLIMKDYQYEK